MRLSELVTKLSTLAILLVASMAIAPCGYAAEKNFFSRQFSLEMSAHFDVWGTEHRGHMQVEGDRVRIPSEANFDGDDDAFSFAFELKNISRLAPNLRIHYLRFLRETSVNRNVQTVFGDITFSEASEQTASLNVFNLGVLSYFSTNINSQTQFDYGAELRRFSGEIRYEGEDANTRAPSEVVYDITGNIISYLPLIYGAITYRFSQLPLRVRSEITGMIISEYSFSDAQIALNYSFQTFTIGAGVRQLRFEGSDEIEESDIDITTEGTFIRIGADF